jgi:pyruvate formate lyase activating enzyme
MAQILKERIFFDQSGGGVTLSGGEPLYQPDFAIAVLKECRRHEIHTAVDTCGFVSSSVLMEALPLTDLFLYDIKHMDPEKHREYTGVDNEVILSNLEILSKAGALIHARMPFIPGVNTDEKNLHLTGAFLSRIEGVVKVSLLPYHNAAEDKHRRWNAEYKLKGLRAPSEDLLKKSAAILESYGLKAEIGG